MKILMCRPDYFGIQYEINPWMHRAAPVNQEIAQKDWDLLFSTYQKLGAAIELAPPTKNLPDLIFSANAALLYGKTAILSSFRHQERRGEEPIWKGVLEKLGFQVKTLPKDIYFEGAGDGLFLGKKLLLGYGFRTTLEVLPHLQKLLPVEILPLELVDPSFYHLDTCFCPLNESTALYYPEAFSKESLEALIAAVPNLIPVTPSQAKGFVCNAMPIGNTVVSSKEILELAVELKKSGFNCLGLPVQEFLKAGGGVRCLSLPLDLY